MYPRPSIFDILLPLSHSISAVLVSRFLLNLREVDVDTTNPVDSAPPSFVNPQLGSVRSAPFFAPMGASLELSGAPLDLDELDGSQREVGAGVDAWSQALQTPGAGPSSALGNRCAAVFTGLDNESYAHR